MEENKVFQKTFLWMFLGLLGTAIVAWYTYSSGLISNLIGESTFAIALIVELVVVLLFTFLFKKLPATIVGILFFVYSMVNGVTLSVIFYTYDLTSIIWAFVATTGLFGGLSLYGYITKKDLSKFGTILFIGLIMGILVSIINLFLKNDIIYIIIDWAILAIFCGITIYDINKIKALAENENMDENKIHIYGAMQLYLDFINLFLRILSIFAKRKD